MIPKRVRKVLGLRPGDRLLVEIEGDRVVLWIRPRSYAGHLRGLHKEVWQGIDATEYVEKESETWN